mgnify:CR=1 FL=1
MSTVIKIAVTIAIILIATVLGYIWLKNRKNRGEDNATTTDPNTDSDADADADADVVIALSLALKGTIWNPRTGYGCNKVNVKIDNVSESKNVLSREFWTPVEDDNILDPESTFIPIIDLSDLRIRQGVGEHVVHVELDAVYGGCPLYVGADGKDGDLIATISYSDGTSTQSVVPGGTVSPHHGLKEILNMKI